MHIHRPKPLSGWREIASEIAIIVVGILIAIGLEQAVETFHHQEQRRSLEAELRADLANDRGVITGDISAARAIGDWAFGQAAQIKRSGPTGAVTLRRMPPVTLQRPDTGVWPAAKAGGQASLLPTGEQNWHEDLNTAEQQTFTAGGNKLDQLTQAFAALDDTIVGQPLDGTSGTIDLSSLDGAQRAIVVERLVSIAERAGLLQNVLRQILDDTDYILVMNGRGLDDRKNWPKFFEIVRRHLRQYPERDFVFMAP